MYVSLCPVLSAAPPPLLSDMCESLALHSGIKDRACQLYKEAMETGAMKGKGMDPVGAGCIYLACRNEGNPRTFKEVQIYRSRSTYESYRTQEPAAGKCTGLLPLGLRLRCNLVLGKIARHVNKQNT